MGHPQPSQFEAATNATFDALMWALSRPGTERTLPEAGTGGIVDALIDRECRVFADDPSIEQRAARAGAEMVPVEHADHVFFDMLTSTDMLDRLSLGSDLYPDDGATLVMSADLSGGRRLQLTGPGVEGAETLDVGGLPDGFWAKRQLLSRYPMGFELFLVDGTRVVGIPRSTTVEVL